ncbi:MAG: hypothetical protein ACI4CS_03160 [Candidatus Weimeria sp.]
MSAAIALSNYFASAKGYRSALAVTDRSETVLRMLSEMKCVDLNPAGYADKFLTYYVIRDSRDVKMLKSKGYERIVIAADAGSADENMLEEVDILRLFGDVSPWCYYDIRKNNRFFISDFTEGVQRSGKFLFTASARKCDTERLMTEFKTRVIETGFFKDPYRLCKNDITMVERFL